MSAKKQQYTSDSVKRALSHHELTGALYLVSPPIVGRGGKWRVSLPHAGGTYEFSLAEAHALCVGLAAAERHYKQQDTPKEEQ